MLVLEYLELCMLLSVMLALPRRKIFTFILKSAPHKHQYGHNKICSHATEPTTTIILTDYFNNYNFSKLK
jgi:hypothetical protein